MKPRIFTVAVALIASGLSARPVSACSGPGCGAGDILPSSGQVPQNALGWLVASPWGQTDGGTNQATFRVFVEPTEVNQAKQEVVLEPDTLQVSAYQTRVNADLLLVPLQPLPVGTKLRIEKFDECTGAKRITQLEVTPSAALPTELGKLEFEVDTGTLNVWTDSASCVDPLLMRYAKIGVELKAEAKPFADVLRYVLLVNNKPYYGEHWIEGEDRQRVRASLAGSALGAGTERLFALCGASKSFEDDEEFGGYGLGVSEGVYELQMAALLPDGSAILSDKQEVELRCPSCSSSGDACASETDGGAKDPSDAGARQAVEAPSPKPTMLATSTSGAANPSTAASNTSPLVNPKPSVSSPMTVMKEPAATPAPSRRKSDCSVVAVSALSSDSGAAMFVGFAVTFWIRRRRGA